MRRSRIISSERGFTLVELLVSLAIFSVMMVAVYGIYNNSAKAFFSQENSVQMTQDLRSAMELLAWEVRMAGFVDTEFIGVAAGFSNDQPTSSFFDDADQDPDRATAASWTTDADSIQFTMDITGGEADGNDNDHDGNTDEADEVNLGDGSLNGSNEGVVYYRDGDTVYRRALNAAGDKYICRPLITNVTNFGFRYFRSNGTEITSPSTNLDAIRTVEITLTAQTAKADILSHQPKSGTLVQRVRVRNAGLLEALENEFNTGT